MPPPPGIWGDKVVFHMFKDQLLEPNRIEKDLSPWELATSFDIPDTICLLVFYSHINAISSLYSRDLIV